MHRPAIVALILAAVLGAVATSATAQKHAHWSYEGATGPSHWGNLEADFGTCAQGRHQSPVNIRPGTALKAALPPLQFSYQPVPLRIVDNGHSVQVNYAPGSFITVGGKRYDLLQFHFHRPSEEALDGKRRDMVAHLVHRDAQGQLAVVAVLLEAGAASPLLETLWDRVPAAKGSEHLDEGVRINAADLLPPDRGYYTFAGSLTTPPCSEGVTWFVLKTPAAVSTQQIARFAVRYPMNARPVQSLHGRVIQATP